ncbi:MAG TPA: flagellar FlbD family protein [Candidatus Acidoferrales bacterium]|nr:flagellar FlbD family protein [Candidatus Acidoferrales bacterium]
MIRLTRLNNQPLVINSDLIKSVESAPDTVLTLVTGEKIVVLESCDDVLERIIEFRRRVLEGLPVPPLHLPESSLPARDLRGETRPPAKRT